MERSTNHFIVHSRGSLRGCEYFATPLAGVVPSLLRYRNSQRFLGSAEAREPPGQARVAGVLVQTEDMGHTILLSSIPLSLMWLWHNVRRVV
jgi:hypothetical protein